MMDKVFLADAVRYSLSEQLGKVAGDEYSTLYYNAFQF
jgi:hypothetical protein